MPLWKYLCAIGILPFTVAVVVPALLLSRTRDRQRPPARHRSQLVRWARLASGLGFLAVGLWLVATTVRLFAKVGKGTLAPWDPTEKLVLVGPYRYVRNPMISGVLFVLLGEAALFASFPLFGWTSLFFLVNAVYIPLSEEPGLEKRFGADYRRYRANVPRWLPRWSPWKGRTS